MAELIPASFEKLVTQLYREPEVQGTLFGLPRHRWYRPDTTGPDFSITFHGRRAATPVGPAAGPHTQMAQNLLLSYVAGSRILELKTVQVNDRLTIPRPCIDMAGVGYNVEWSQELTLERSLREYVAGAMLVEMFRHGDWGVAAALDRGPGEVLYEVSVGYDRQGIQSSKVGYFLDAMRDADAEVERLRSRIPSGYAHARGLVYPKELAGSITLSTFHGCPADEIEQICEFLLGEKGFDVSVKLNPTLLGRERIEHLLHEVMGYQNIAVNPLVFASGLAFDQAVELCRRLASYAQARGRHFVAKLCNTLEVKNHRRFFPSACQLMYLSGQPLYVITMTLADELRKALGPIFPLSYSGGIDKTNFPQAVASGFVPVTVCTDLLRPGGYGRLPAYLEHLGAEMRKVGAGNIADFVRLYGGGTEESGVDIAARHLTRTAEIAQTEIRYHSATVCRELKRLDRTLAVFDCISCDKCIPVCPNAAIFAYSIKPATTAYRNLVVDSQGQWQWEDVERQWAVKEDRQIAVYADFCNECGNCGTFCPEQGAPYRDKPGFYGTQESWSKAAPRDAYLIETTPQGYRIHGRVEGCSYLLETNGAGEHCFKDDSVEVVLDWRNGEILAVRLLKSLTTPHRVDFRAYHVLKYLLEGVVNTYSINPVNVARFHKAE